MSIGVKDLDVSKVCRICLQAEDAKIDRVLINIFIEEKGFSITESLMQVCGIRVTQTDHLPQQICSTCLPRLRNAFLFVQLSHRSQQTLVANVQSKQVATPSKAANNAPSFEYIEFPETLSEYKSEAGSDTASCEEKSDKQIVCCGCGVEFDCEKTLRKHSVQVHCPKKPSLMLSGKIRCNVCYVPLGNEDEVRAHVERYPNVRTLKECSYCRCNFYGEDALEAHVGQFHADRLFKCCACVFQSDNQIDLATHAMFHKHAARKLYPEEGSANYFHCAVCYARFETLRKRQCHERLPFLKVEKGVKPLRAVAKVPESSSKRFRPCTVTCDKCALRFPDEESLKEHTCIEVFECPNCHKSFIKKETLECHKCITNKPVFKCRKCSKNFLDEAKALLCMRSHKADRKVFQCKVCFTNFTAASSLKHHMDTHTANRNFPCRYCPAKFLRALGRDNHEVRHTRKSLYKCGVCGRPSNLRQEHIQHYEARD